MLQTVSRLARRLELIVRLMETWVRRPATPRRLVLDVTRRCNLRCQMCHTWRVEPRHELTPDEIRTLLRQMPGLVWLDITGGEPFLRRDAAEIFRAALDSLPNLRVLHFQTNGWFQHRVIEVAREIVASRPDLDLIVTVSLDGPPAVHDSVRGREGSFDRALGTFVALRDVEGVEVYVGTTVTPFNAESVEDLGLLLHELVPGFRSTEWHWNWMQISGHFFNNADLAGPPPVPTGGLVKRHVMRRGVPRTLVDLMELVFLVNLEFYRKGEPSGVVCQALRSAAFISPEGDLYPCHVYDRPLGNVRNAVVRELWAAEHVTGARSDIKELACGGCFTPCEAYPALAGAPLQTARQTGRRALKLLTGRA